MLYIKNINGYDVIKDIKDIVITKDGKTTIHPSEYDVIKNGWTKYIDKGPTLDEIKNEVIERLLAYDGSADVNTFYIGEQQMWLDKATRVGLKLRFDAEIHAGKQTTTLWQNGVGYTLPLVGELTALDILDGIELYASYCYDTTQLHLSNIMNAKTADEVNQYDYKTGYPDKLRF